ncbi:FAD-dependent oxidoreductase [Elongatibacter sediminis]|uniref:FAD-dependent oxidoreductase n=1 Tax=Elongatibacter sediminis TaxID=3119006 RepID=A0AAW9RBE1_9GAMM
MTTQIKSVVVLGGGSAGFLSALAFRATLPGVQVTVLHSSGIPAIGVGESTTRALPAFLHGPLGLERKAFYDAVRPIWKVGQRLDWGSPDRAHFNYPFDSFLTNKRPELPQPNLYYCLHDMQDSGLSYSLMDQHRAPVFVDPAGRVTLVERFGYHIENQRFLNFLEQTAADRGVEIIDGRVREVVQAENGDVETLRLEGGGEMGADVFVDCSGFRSVLLKEAMGEKYVSYADALFADSAVVGSWRRDTPIIPYTKANTMEHGWCWNIEFTEHITRGYVFSSAFCSDDVAVRELREKNPKLGDDLRTIRFPSGRYENFWVRNVIGIGNASGFVEPLEATALQLIVEQLRFVTKALIDSGGDPSPAMREFENHRYRARWDDVRDFLALHYKFNRQSDSAFWRHARAETSLGGARDFVDYYREAGPTILSLGMVGDRSIFGFDGYMNMLLGMKVPTERPPRLTDEEQAGWRKHQADVRARAGQALTAEQALERFRQPDFDWNRLRIV